MKRHSGTAPTRRTARQTAPLHPRTNGVFVNHVRQSETAWQAYQRAKAAHPGCVILTCLGFAGGAALTGAA